MTGCSCVHSDSSHSGLPPHRCCVPACDCQGGTITTIGAKGDAGKLRFDLLPVEGLSAVARVLEYGAKKYGEHNWRHVKRAQARYVAAALRHVFAHVGGEALDPESGEPHLAHAACSILFMLSMPKDAL